jgi:hypothetical protein
LRKTTLRERRILLVMSALLAVACVAAAVVAIASSAPRTPAGCVRVELPSTMGAVASDLCGQTARTFCGSEAAHSEPLEHTALPKCREAGFVD